MNYLQKILRAFITIFLAQTTVSCSENPGKFVLAKNSTPDSSVMVLTERYENNLYQLTEWLPARWDLIAVLKWSAYGNDIHILGPVAAGIVPAIGIRSNEGAKALLPYHPKSIIRIAPTNYKMAKEAVVNKLNVTEFIGTLSSLKAVQQVAKEEKMAINASIFLFDHYGDPWGFEFNTPEELQKLVDSIDPSQIKIRGIFMHLGYLEDAPSTLINEKIIKFLQVSCPVAVKIANSLGEDESILVHWGASSEMSRLWDSDLGVVKLPSTVQPFADACLKHPKVRFALRLGSITLGSAEYDFPELRPVLWWKSTIASLFPTNNTNIAVVNVGIDNGYPRIFRPHGKWGAVDIAGKRYPLAEPPHKDKILIDVGPEPENSVYPGAEVCLLCDRFTLDDLFKLVAEDTYNIAMCATGADTKFAEESRFVYDDAPTCKGPVKYIEPRNIRGPKGELLK